VRCAPLLSPPAAGQADGILGLADRDAVIFANRFAF
jgi:hypothetical protein